MAKIHSVQLAEVAVDRQEDEPGPVLPASIEMLPSDDARQPRHELGCVPKIGETRRSPNGSQQGQAEELAPLAGRQAEGRREATKERDFLRPDRRLYRRATAKELEPSRIHAMHFFGVPAKRCLVDEPLRAVETPPTDFRGETLLEVTLDRSDQVRH
jgi:hypothetical protein